MCEECSIEAKSFGEILPGYRLIQATQDGWYIKNGQWAVVCGNDPDFYWVRPPESAPPEIPEDDHHPDSERLFNEHNEWLTRAEGAMRTAPTRASQLPRGFDPSQDPFPFRQTHKLVEAGLKAGWNQDEHGDFELWLFSRAGQWIKDHPMPDPDPFGHGSLVDSPE
jgi:hypothetical protein